MEEKNIANELFGLTGDHKAKETSDEVEAESEEEDEEGDLPTDESEDETEESDEAESEEEDEEEEEAELSDKAKLTRALRAERAERKIDNERAQTVIKQLNTLILDPDFLAHQYQKIQTDKEEGKTNPKPVQIDVPYAPAYPNTQIGHQRLESDQIRATSILPEIVNNETIRGMIEFEVSRGKTYVEATQQIKKELGPRINKAKEDQELDKEESVSKKKRMTTQTKPRVGALSSSQSLEKRIDSQDKRTRERAAIESLGMI